MLIKSSTTPAFDAKAFRPRPIVVVIVKFAIVLTLLTVAAVAGAVIGRSDVIEKVAKAASLNPLTVVKNYASGFRADPEHLTIDIKHKHYVKLAEWRRLALERNQITSDLKNYVPVSIRHKDHEMKADIRLKGEWTDHVETDKWSFRVKLKGDERLFGMKRFSLQHPRTRSFMNEWLYQHALAHEGVVALRYQFVTVTVNGRHLGVYALEEHFTKQLIENNERREGVMVRFDAELRYKPFALDFGSRRVKVPGILRTTVKEGIGTQPASHIVAYDEEKLVGDEGLKKQFEVAYNLLQSFRDGRLPTHKVFDVDKLASYFAVSEMMGALWTADDWSDMRFIYNPITSRLEPIAVEGYDYVRIESLLGAKYNCGQIPENNFHALLFSDPVFFERYIDALEKVSQSDFLENLCHELEPEMTRQERIIHSEFPHRDLARDVFSDNAKAIRYLLSPAKGLHAYLTGQDEITCQIEMGAIQPLPVEVIAVTQGDVQMKPSSPVILKGMPKLGRPLFQTVTFRRSESPDSKPAVAGKQSMVADPLSANQLQVHYRLLGTHTERTDAVFRRPRSEATLVESDLLRMDGNVDKFEFLRTDEQAKTITVLPGTWQVGENLVFPAGYTVVAGAGVDLNLGPSVDILSYSPLRFSGESESPVVLESTDGQGHGLTVIKANETSVLRHVVFKKLSTPRQGGWELTGAVTFYDSPVEFHNCEFLEVRSEDVLNVVQTEFVLSDTLFYDTISDAVDADFCTGTIVNCNFTNIAGDAIDVSGSEVELGHLQIQNVADKGISVGEGSHVVGNNIQIRQAKIGVAAKDLSSGEFDDLTISDCQIGLTVFQKKPEFGPARIEATHVTFNDTAIKFLVEHNSSLMVDGREIPASHSNLKERFYPIDEATSTVTSP